MSSENKFPWVEFLSSFVFYIVIAALIYVVASMLPKPVQQQLSAEQVQQIQQQQQLEQTNQVYNTIISRVNQLMVVPQTQPEISVITDIQVFLAQYPAFAGAQTGDAVLVYPDRVIVYSPANNRIVNSVLIPADVQRKNAEQRQKQLEQQQNISAPATKTAPAVESPKTQ